MADPTTIQKRGVFLYVAGDTFDFWQSYSVRSDLLDATGSFHFRTPLKPERNTRELLAYDSLVPGVTVDLFVTTGDGKVTHQLHGRIDVVEVEDGDDGTHLEVSGRGHTWRLVDGDIIPTISMDGVTARDVIYRVTAAYGYSSTQIVVSNDADRVLLTGKPASGTTLSKDAPIDLTELKPQQAMPHAGETAWSFLTRHTRRFGLLIWGTADGKIVVGRPNYDQKPLYTIAMRYGAAATGNNANHLSRRRSALGIPSEVHVYGKSIGHDFTKSPVHAVVTEPTITDFVPLTVQDHTVADKTQATRRAQYELSLRKQGADVFGARMKGHLGSTGAVFAIDTIADVQWDGGSQHGPLYVIRRNLECTRGDAEHTTLELVPKGSIALT